MNKNELKEVLNGINNQLDGNERAEVIRYLIEIIGKKDREQLLSHCEVMYSGETNLSLLENGIITEEEHSSR